MTALPDVNHSSMTDHWPRCHRFQRSFRNIGLVCAISFFLIGVASTAAALCNIDGSFARPKLAALVFAVFWSSFTLLGIWLILVYVRSSLRLNDQCIQQTGCFRARTMPFDELVRAQWRSPRGGSLVLRTAGGKLTVEFNVFTPRERGELIQFLHNRVNEHLQEGWPQFESRFPVSCARSGLPGGP